MRDGRKEGSKKMMPYPSQLVQDLFIHAAFLEINSGAFDNIGDDLRIGTSDLCIRHPDGVDRVEMDIRLVQRVMGGDCAMLAS